MIFAYGVISKNLANYPLNCVFSLLYHITLTRVGLEGHSDAFGSSANPTAIRIGILTLANLLLVSALGTSAILL